MIVTYTLKRNPLNKTVQRVYNLTGVEEHTLLQFSAFITGIKNSYQECLAGKEHFPKEAIKELEELQEEVTGIIEAIDQALSDEASKKLNQIIKDLTVEEKPN